MPDPVIRVTVEDLIDGTTDTVEIPAGEYVVLATEPCHVDRVQTHANGTHVVTIKGRNRGA
jgi:hypothetical protein